jgi:NAD(P)H dehydrogenase (quinone)
MKKILITGANGHLGRSIIQQLLTKWPASSIVAMVRNPDKAEDLKALGLDVVYGDYLHEDSLRTAMRNVERVMFISSSEFANRLQQHQNVVNAAKSAGVKHISYTSVCMHNPDTSPISPLLGDHAKTERFIQDSGLAYTFFRNTLYAEVIPLFLGEAVLKQGVFFASGEGKVPFALREELGEAIANGILLQEEGNKVYELTGSELISFGDVANLLSEHTGSIVPWISTELKEYEAALKSFGLPEEIVGMSVLFSAGIRNRDFEKKEDHLRTLLGRNPTSVHQFLKVAYPMAERL